MHIFLLLLLMSKTEEQISHWSRVY